MRYNIFENGEYFDNIWHMRALKNTILIENSADGESDDPLRSKIKRSPQPSADDAASSFANIQIKDAEISDGDENAKCSMDNVYNNETVYVTKPRQLEILNPTPSLRSKVNGQRTACADDASLKCDVCKQPAYKRKADFDKHMEFHANPLKCKYCEIPYQRAAALTVHEKLCGKIEKKNHFVILDPSMSKRRKS